MTPQVIRETIRLYGTHNKKGWLGTMKTNLAVAVIAGLALVLTACGKDSGKQASFVRVGGTYAAPNGDTLTFTVPPQDSGFTLKRGASTTSGIYLSDGTEYIVFTTEGAQVASFQCPTQFSETTLSIGTCFRTTAGSGGTDVYSNQTFTKQ